MRSRTFPTLVLGLATFGVGVSMPSPAGVSMPSPADEALAAGDVVRDERADLAAGSFFGGSAALP